MAKNNPIKFYEVEARNRVVNALEQRIRGKQGSWYPEYLYFLAESEEEAKDFARDLLESRQVLGVRLSRRAQLNRQVKIKKVRRIA